MLLCISPHRHVVGGALDSKAGVNVHWSFFLWLIEVVVNYDGAGNELYAGMMVWASQQVGRITAGSRTAVFLTSKTGHWKS